MEYFFAYLSMTIDLIRLKFAPKYFDFDEKLKVAFVAFIVCIIWLDRFGVLMQTIERKTSHREPYMNFNNPNSHAISFLIFRILRRTENIDNEHFNEFPMHEKNKCST